MKRLIAMCRLHKLMIHRSCVQLLTGKFLPLSSTVPFPLQRVCTDAFDTTSAPLKQ